MRNTTVDRESTFREMERLALQIPTLPHPTLEELQAKFSGIKSVERDTSPTDAVALTLGTVLRPYEKQIGGPEYELRRAPLAGRMCGYQQLKWLVDHQDEHPDFRALLDKIYIDGPGLVVVFAVGIRRFPYLIQGGGRWVLYWGRIEDDLVPSGRIAVAGLPA